MCRADTHARVATVTRSKKPLPADQQDSPLVDADATVPLDEQVVLFEEAYECVQSYRIVLILRAMQSRSRDGRALGRDGS